MGRKRNYLVFTTGLAWIVLYALFLQKMTYLQT